MLVVIAQPEELKLVKELGYENCPILITGVGGMNAIKALKNFPRDTEILNIGYAGSNNLKVGTIVEIEKVRTNHHLAKFSEPFKFLKRTNYYNSVFCVSSTDFVEKTNETTDCVFDMELAFICAMFDNVYSIKVVSDNLNYKEYKKKVK